MPTTSPLARPAARLPLAGTGPLSITTVLATLLAAAPAAGRAAEDPTRRGFDADPHRLALSLDGGFAAETAAAAAEGTWRAGALLELSDGLLVLRQGGRTDDLLGPRLALHLLGGWSLGRAELGVELPVALWQQSDLGLLTSQGVIQNLAPYGEVTTLEGAKQVLAMGPVASQEAIKELGTNGGGFFNANSAHPFENPTPFTNMVEMLLIFAIPAALTYTYGRMAGDQKQGWAIFAAMAVLFFAGVTALYAAEVGNLEGKEVRFGTAASALFATVTTDASCGAVNSMHDSFTPLGGLVPLVNIQLGEVIFGGVGAGLYGILVMVLLAVFIAGLMVGRTPEYLGKKIEGREMKLAMLYILIFPLTILSFTAWAAVAPYGVSSLHNAGPHGLSELLYAYTSGAGNNGSAFAGLDANTPFWNITLGVAMLVGRFFMIIPALAIAGSMVGKKTVAPGPGTFPTNGALFSFLLVAVVLIVGALTFFPALSLSPIVEHFMARNGRVF